MVRGLRKTARKLAFTLDAAATVAEILKARGISFAIFGSLASSIYGADRIPDDVDVVIFEDPNREESSGSQTETPRTEELKALIFRARPGDFYLKDAKSPEATYKILTFRPSPSATRPARTQKQIIRSPDPECKVDVLIPGILHLPYLRPELVYWHSIPQSLRTLSYPNLERVPLVPFSLLLVHKLQGWDDNRKAPEGYKRGRQKKDAKDVERLLKLEQWYDVVKEASPAVWNDSNLFGDELRALTRERVKDYSKAFPFMASRWSELGFELD